LGLLARKLQTPLLFKKLLCMNGKKRGTDSFLRATFILIVIGTVVSIYMVKDHYNTKNSICDLGNRISCSVINKSSYSELFSVPIAVFGVTWFLVLLAFTLKIRENSGDVIFWATAHLIWSAAGLLFCFYLIFAEIVLGTICPFCTIVHIVCFLIMYLSTKIYTQLKMFPPVLETIAYFLSKQRGWVLFIGVIHVAPLLYFNVYPMRSKESQADVVLHEFAKCISQSGLIMFGSDDCFYCNRQKELFGTSFQYVAYVNCKESATECAARKVEGLPTWLSIDHKTPSTEMRRHVGLLTIKELAAFSNCNIT